MRRAPLLAGVALGLTSTLAFAAPESLLPPIFSDPAPAPAPAPAPTPTPRPAATAGPSATAPAAPATPVIQRLPDDFLTPPEAIDLPADFPSLAELERMDPDEIDALFGLRPKFDIPPGAQRAVARVGIIAPDEGGFATGSLAGQPAALIDAALRGTRGPLVSRWGHILLRRALASRLDAPEGANPVTFAAQRAALLNRIGESQAARALVQDIDTANYSPALAGVALDAYLATGDILGLCPVVRLHLTLRDDTQWEMMRSICAAYSGDPARANQELVRMRSGGRAPAIDALLAQRYAGAAGRGRNAVNIEWDAVEELTPWRFGLSRALGVELPDGLRAGAGARYDMADVLIPAVPLPQRIAAADRAAERGVISAAAMVDLYAQLFADRELQGGDARQNAVQLREAYVAGDVAARLAAMRGLWREGAYGRKVLTAYAAARLPVSADLEDDAADIIASMLTAGLDRNAMRWANVVGAGSPAWGLLAVAQPEGGAVSGGAVGNFIDADESPGQRKSRFLVAGLAALERVDMGTARGLASDLGFELERESPWAARIDRAGELRNQALVSLLAAVGMQGSGWDKMTPRHLFHIVRALDRAGLNAEARMIAAEAVARG